MPRMVEFKMEGVRIMKVKVVTLLSKTLKHVAEFNIKPASIGWAYQPKAPKSLK